MSDAEGRRGGGGPGLARACDGGGPGSGTIAPEIAYVSVIRCARPLGVPVESAAAGAARRHGRCKGAGTSGKDPL